MFRTIRTSSTFGFLPRKSYTCPRCLRAAEAQQKRGFRATPASRIGKKYWSPEKLVTAPEYPLSKSLDGRLNPITRTSSRTKKGKTMFIRSQIVSPELCDDVFKYIGKDLEKYKGCDLLDLNPGAGLWSQKIHEFLKPRNHVLIEPNMDTFGDYLQPLLQAKDSKYKLFERDPTEFPIFSELIDEGYLPDQKRVAKEDVNAQEPNNTLLVTGQLIWDPPLPGKGGFDSVAKQALLHYSNYTWSNQAFHALGPTRMLLWLSTHDVKSMAPRTQQTNTKPNFWVSKQSKITEVVSPSIGKRGINSMSTREHRYILEGLVAGLKSGKENGYEIPPQRRDYTHDLIEDFLEQTHGTAVMSVEECTEFLKYQYLVKGRNIEGLMMQHLVEYFKLQHENPDRPKMTPKTDDAVRKLWHRISTHGAAARMVLKIQNQRDATIELGAQIYDLECEILGMKADSPEKASALEKLEKMQTQYDEALSSCKSNFRSAIVTDMDERISMRSPVERLAYDSRPYEPLVAKPTECWPPREISLLDIDPRPIPPDESPEFFEWTKDFTYGLLSDPATPLPTALEKMQSGASDIMEMCPSLWDPKKGGRLQMKNLRVRMLTHEMVKELTRAYQEWPFRDEDAGHSWWFKMKAGSAKKSAGM